MTLHELACADWMLGVVTAVNNDTAPNTQALTWGAWNFVNLRAVSFLIESVFSSGAPFTHSFHFQLIRAHEKPPAKSFQCSEANKSKLFNIFFCTDTCLVEQQLIKIINKNTNNVVIPVNNVSDSSHHQQRTMPSQLIRSTSRYRNVNSRQSVPRYTFLHFIHDRTLFSTCFVSSVLSLCLKLYHFLSLVWN